MSESQVESESEPEAEAVEWQCQNCHERHASNFFACWKCGSDRAGVPDPEFSVYDTASIHFFDSLENHRDLKLQLPDSCYYLLPICLLHASYELFSMSTPVLSIDSLVTSGELPFNFTEITSRPVVGLLALTLFFPLVLFPIGVQCWKLIPELFSRRDSATSLDQLETVSRKFLQMFVLPETIGNSSPWFQRFYYVSFLVLLLAPLAKFLQLAIIGLD